MNRTRSTRYFKNLTNGEKFFHFFQKKGLSFRAKAAILLMEKGFFPHTRSPAGELLSGDDEKATFSTFFTQS